MTWQGVPPKERAPDGSRGIGILNQTRNSSLDKYTKGMGFPAQGKWPRKYEDAVRQGMGLPKRPRFIANAEEKSRRKVKRRYEVPPGTYRVEWDNVNPSGESYVDFEYTGGSWSNFDDAWMDVFVANAGPKVTQDGEKMGEMYQFAAEALGKDSCCCGATKENPCECMIQGIMQCSATCPCSSKKYSAEDAEDYGVQPAWMAENTSDLDYANLTDWANANDSDDMKYLVGGFFGGVLSTIIGAIAGEWTIQKLKGKGLL